MVSILISTFQLIKSSVQSKSAFQCTWTSSYIFWTFILILAYTVAIPSTRAVHCLFLALGSLSCLVCGDLLNSAPNRKSAVIGVQPLHTSWKKKQQKRMEGKLLKAYERELKDNVRKEKEVSEALEMPGFLTRK